MRPWTLPLASLVIACAPVRVGEPSRTGSVDTQEESFYGSGTVVASMGVDGEVEFHGSLDGSGEIGFARQPDCDSPDTLQIECGMYQVDGDYEGVLAVDLEEGAFSFCTESGDIIEGTAEDVDLEARPGSAAGTISGWYILHSRYVLDLTIEVDLSPAHACP